MSSPTLPSTLTWLDEMKEKIMQEEAARKQAQQLCLVTPSKEEVGKQLGLPLADGSGGLQAAARQENPETALVQCEVSAQGKSDLQPAQPVDMEAEQVGKRKSLEDYEAEALQQLENKKTKKNEQTAKKNATTKAKAGPCFKRPAGRVQPAPKAEGEGDKAKGEYGCIRCRGNTWGCSECQRKDFQGLRLNGREAWREYMETRKGK